MRIQLQVIGAGLTIMSIASVVSFLQQHPQFDILDEPRMGGQFVGKLLLGALGIGLIAHGFMGKSKDDRKSDSRRN